LLRPVAETGQRVQTAQNVPGLKLQHHVDIVRVTQVAVGIDRQPPHDEITHLSFVEGLDDFDEMRGLHESETMSIGGGRIDGAKLTHQLTYSTLKRPQEVSDAYQFPAPCLYL
jgi:hypothetical protein